MAERKNRVRFPDYEDEEEFYDEDDMTPEKFADVIYQHSEELYKIESAIPDRNGLIDCPVIILGEMVLYPQMVLPIFVEEDDETELAAIEHAQINKRTVIGLVKKDAETVVTKMDDLLPIGVEISVGHSMHMPDGTISVLVQARQRVELVKIIRGKTYWRAKARPINEVAEVDHKMRATMRTALELFKQCVDLNDDIPEEVYSFANRVEEPGWLADMIVSTLPLSLEIRHELLLLTDPGARLERVVNLLAQEADVLKLEGEIQARVQSEMDRGQREIYLREQMKAIQNELGDGDTWEQDLDEIRQKIEKADLPEEVKSVAVKEAGRLSQMPPMSPELGVIRTYLDWILELPWNAVTEDNLDVEHAEKVLDEYHFGLPKVKERILEYIAVRSLKPKRMKHPILCFVGPPGTGKTSLGRSIAEALGRKFSRLSLGGVRDEAEIRGHRRTYIGSMPGRILQTIRRAGTKNPLFMLDEIDKLGVDYRGDPASALLEVLDPEQNNTFSDHYLEVPFDLSQVMFITTANIQDTIPLALLDRMEIIEFPGYIEEEKLEIADRFLVPRQLEECGIDKEEIHFSDQALQRVIREYTYEAGVRNLEREIGRISRKIARLKASAKPFPNQISASSIERYLGPPQFFGLESERQDEIGVATALAWSQNGGEIMPIEVLLMDGKGNLQVTGQIGDIMQESAQAAMSYLKSRSKLLGIESQVYECTDVHIHVPEGAIPKDGPSAGITIATALISAFSHRKCRRDVGMTGEITLRGRVLPVGGVRDKILAAHRAGLKIVIIPKRNEKDLVEITKKARNALQIVKVEHMDEVLDMALLPAEPNLNPNPEPVKRHKRKISKTKKKPGIVPVNIQTGEHLPSLGSQ
ncbi:MAG: endopeptidase La [Chloroflexota bacterium]